MQTNRQRRLTDTDLQGPSGLRSGALCTDALRHARLFEMIRQQSLAERALQRLHLQSLSRDRPSIPSPASLGASLMAQPALDPSDRSLSS